MRHCTKKTCNKTAISLKDDLSYKLKEINELLANLKILLTKNLVQ